MSVSNVQNPRPQSGVVSVLGAKTSYWEYGNPHGPALVLVHGFRGDHHGLEQIAVRLPDFRVIVPDLPGFGISEALPERTHDLPGYAEWLRGFTEALDLPCFFLLGHSFGSLIVSESVAGGLRPDRLILVNPIAAPALEGPKGVLTKLAVGYYRAAALLPERAGRALLSNGLIVRGMSETMAKTRDPELRAWIHDQHDQYFSHFSDKGTLLEAFRASVSGTVRERARNIPMETLVIASDRDDLTPLHEVVSLCYELPAGELRVVPGVGHLVHYEAPGDAAAWITAFLNEPLNRTPWSPTSSNTPQPTVDEAAVLEAAVLETPESRTAESLSDEHRITEPRTAEPRTAEPRTAEPAATDRALTQPAGQE